MEAQPPTPAPRGMRFSIWLSNIVYVAILIFLAITAVVAWPTISAAVWGTLSSVPAQTQATASVPTKPLQQPVQPRNAAAPAIPGVAQNAATAQAMYEAAVEAAAPIPNTNPAPAPAVLVSKPAARQPAPDVVPTALPLPQGESGSIFGSKPAIVNPQEERACLHGQTWTERGCKNPTPVR